MSDTYRVGKTLRTTIFRNKDGQSCAMTFGLPEAEAIELAARITALLNAESSPVAVASEGEPKPCWRCGGRGIAGDPTASNRSAAIPCPECDGNKAASEAPKVNE